MILMPQIDERECLNSGDLQIPRGFLTMPAWGGVDFLDVPYFGRMEMFAGGSHGARGGASQCQLMHPSGNTLGIAAPSDIALCNPLAVLEDLHALDETRGGTTTRVDFQKVLAFLRQRHPFKNALMLLARSYLNTHRERFYNYVRHHTDWNPVVTIEADWTLCDDDDPISTWIMAELECLSFPRHANNSTVATIGNLRERMLPCIHRYLARGGRLISVSFVDLMDDRVRDFLESREKVIVLDLARDLQACWTTRWSNN